MSWVCEITGGAKRDLRGLPKAVQQRVAHVLDQMAGDPFQGNVKALQGQQWKGVFRRRLGDDRLIFMPDYTKRIVYILRILIRSGGTCR